MMARVLRQFVAGAVELAEDLRSRIEARLRSDELGESLRAIHAWVESATDRELDEDGFVDLYAQTVACAAAVISLRRDVFRDVRVCRWLLAGANSLWKQTWGDCFSLAGVNEEEFSQNRNSIGGASILRRAANDVILAEADRAGDCSDPVVHFYEQFLHAHDSRGRTKHGVFYTPRPIARYIVKQVDRYLRDEFRLVDGLADTSTWQQVVDRHDRMAVPNRIDPRAAFVSVLDPALGSGVFLAEVIDLVHSRLVANWTAQGSDPDQVGKLWDEYATKHLLPRICGLELLLPACAVAHLELVDKLAETGFSFEVPAKLEIRLINTLAGPKQQLSFLDASTAEGSRAAKGARDACYARPFTVVVGNPPFSGISRDRSRWIVDLLRGRGDWASYYEVDGRPLGERKHWLQDDYVKFMRYAHWKIESAGYGIVGLVTNHGYLDNPTFRGMRQQFMHTFPRITVVDLHGNRKKKEQAPDGGVDENVFQIEQGTAIGLFRRPPGAATARDVRHAELWGEAEKKLAALSSTTAGAAAMDDEEPLLSTEVEPSGPNYFFVPRDDALRREYERGYRLSDMMPINVTAPVTARDSFVVGFDEEELLDRMTEFRNLAIPDDEIRQRYFTSSRSTKYPPGDTRGWKLPDARRRMADDDNWQDYIRMCWYRPFDQRAIYWADWMIDWPRREIMRHMLAGDNMAIVARRQMLPTQPCTYFWIADGLTLDGVIRSDNRGSESVFPLYLYGDKSDGRAQRRANYDESFISEASRVLGLRWTEDGKGDMRQSFGPKDLAHYVYALFFSPAYRERYADLLRSDFPRVFLIKDAQLFESLSRLGARLADNHLLRGQRATRLPSSDSAGPVTTDGWSVERGFPKYFGGRVLASDQVSFDNVPQDVWEFHVGGHQVCRKWLKDRRGRQLTRADAEVYRQIVASLNDTIDCMKEIDLAIDNHGGWPDAFDRQGAV